MSKHKYATVIEGVDGNDLLCFHDKAPVMTLRQWYAGNALQGILSQSPGSMFGHKNMWKACLVSGEDDAQWIGRVAELSCQFADALLDELEKGKE